MDPALIPATSLDEPLTTADLVAAAVITVPGVAGLNGGVLGGMATYLPGRTVAGVRIRPDGTSVEITVEYGHTLVDVADAVRMALLAVPGVLPPINVSISRLVEPLTTTLPDRLENS